jgi:hypothetical protein
MSPDLLAHPPTCRRPAPVLRLSWAGRPEAWCPGCGRYAPADDTRTKPTNERTHP